MKEEELHSLQLHFDYVNMIEYEENWIYSNITNFIFRFIISIYFSLACQSAERRNERVGIENGL
jgi:hypothetical protein